MPTECRNLQWAVGVHLINLSKISACQLLISNNCHLPCPGLAQNVSSHLLCINHFMTCAIYVIGMHPQNNPVARGTTQMERQRT